MTTDVCAGCAICGKRPKRKGDEPVFGFREKLIELGIPIRYGNDQAHSSCILNQLIKRAARRTKRETLKEDAREMDKPPGTSSEINETH